MKHLILMSPLFLYRKNTNEMLSFMLLVVLLGKVDADLGKVDCPCHIYVNEKGLQEVDCTKQKLTTIPNCVPNSTWALDLSWNDLRYIPGQFQKFGNIVVLVIFGNVKFVAHNDSFNFLTNLKLLDLSFTDLTYVNGEMFLYQSNLRRLYLRGKNGKFSVSQGLFAYLENLQILDLDIKQRFILPNWTFVRLPSLWKLDLSSSAVLVLNKNTFFGLSNLTNLNLLDPLLTMYLPDEVFKPLINLEELHLEGLCSAWHPVFDCKTIDERLQHVPSLKRLYIDKKLISDLGKGFLALKELEELYLLHGIADVDQPCDITELKPESFTNLNNSPLMKLVLSHCNINILFPGWFEHLKVLEEIMLSVTTLAYYDFWNTFSTGLGNTDLHIAQLSITTNNNYVPPLPMTIVDGFNQSQLISLELTDTRFYSVNDDIITKLPKSLKYLNLTHNYILYFGVENLNYLEKLETLDLSNQVDFQKQSSAKSGQDSLEYSYQFELNMLDLTPLLKKDAKNVGQNNQLRFDPQKCFNVTKARCFSLPYRLKYLDVSKSELLCNMVPAFCDSNNSLKILNASVQRDISCLKTGSFWSFLKNLVNIEELNLNGNLIAEIPQDAFSGLYKLKKVLLYNNKLLELSFDVKDLISLQTVDVSANSIDHASKIFTDQIEDLSMKTNLTLYLGLNPLVCNCKTVDFVAWLIVTRVIFNKNKLNCTYENDTQISIAHISHAHHILKYKCTRRDVTISCIVMFWGLNLILGGLAYIWHNRQKLRYLVSFGRRTLNPYHPIEDQDIEMEYDVYISYEGDFYVTKHMTLRDFVIYKILPGLQQRRINVIIREELDPGRNLYEIITQTVRRSKKVLAFLTNGYCQDMWNVFEFNQAVMEGIYTNRQVAIPVLFESLRRDKVKEEIREFLRMEPVHKYSPELSDRAFIDFLYERIRDTRQFG